jgi:hypothetical protein
MTMTQPFHFPDGRIANDAKDLLELCEQYPDDATGFLVRQDLEKWLAYIGNHEVAECAANARQIDVSDRQKLEDFLNRCHSLTSPQAVVSDTPESNLEATVEKGIEESSVTSGSTLSSPITSAPLEPAIQTPSAQDSPLAPPLEAISTPETSTESVPVESSESETFIEPVLPVFPTTPVARTAPESPASSASKTSANNSAVKTPVNPNLTNTDEVKPSFLQVVAKFIMQILYRNKA